MNDSLMLEVSNTVLYCNKFEITSTSEKHMVEDDILFTNHQAVIMGLSSARAQCLTSVLSLDRQRLLSWLWPAQASLV